MASRMDRYYKNELVTSARSEKNKSLYDKIENLENYTNIEGVAAIEKTNEIDISKVQEMIKNREEYKRKKQLSSILKEESEKLVEDEDEPEETRTYDIKSLLSEMEKEFKSDDKIRSLDKEQRAILKKLSKKKETTDFKKDEEEIKGLLNTINSAKALTELDVGLLDELKSDTMVGDASSIKKILEEEKNEPLSQTNGEIDKSFYTSSFGFTKKDFEELKDINHEIKKSNKFIIVLLVVFIALVIVGGLIFLFSR